MGVTRASAAIHDVHGVRRVTAPYAASETGYTRQYVRDRLRRLVEHGTVEKVHEGLYELVADPREEETGERIEIPNDCFRPQFD